MTPTEELTDLARSLAMGDLRDSLTDGLMGFYRYAVTVHEARRIFERRAADWLDPDRLEMVCAALDELALASIHVTIDLNTAPDMRRWIAATKGTFAAIAHVQWHVEHELRIT